MKKNSKSNRSVTFEWSRLRYIFNVYVRGKGSLPRSWIRSIRINKAPCKNEEFSFTWFIDYSREAEAAKGELDSSRVPQIDYANIGVHYNPWYIGQVGLGLISEDKSRENEQSIKHFITISDWFVNNAVAWGPGVSWPYYFNWQHGRSAPWISSLSQAHGLAVLLRAWKYTGKSEYRDCAELASRLFLERLDNGGVSFTHEDGTVSFEEIISESVYENPITTFNGHITSCLAMLDASRALQCKQFLDLYHQGLQFVKAQAHHFDLGYWSLYNKDYGLLGLPSIASRLYHEVHIQQLYVLTLLTNDSRFHELHSKFVSYEQSSICRVRAHITKSLFKVLHY